MDNTKIDWADMSWNPVTGCCHGCEYCYARSIAHRFAGFEPRSGGEIVPDDKKKYGNNSVWNSTHGETLHVFSEQPMKRTKSGVFQKASFPYGFEPTFHRYRLAEPTRKQRPRNIFVGSMTDLFGDWVPVEWIKEVFEACRAAPQHNYLFLTKNPARYAELAKRGLLPKETNYWYGSTTTRQGAAYWIDPDYYTFRSIEPLLCAFDRFEAPIVYADWVIIGAETGQRGNRILPKREWIEAIVDNCRATETPVFMKGSLADIWGKPLIREFPPELKWR